MRPILFDINSALDGPVRIDRPVVPLRVKLLGSLPLINVITGVVVAALTSDGGGTDALGINVLIALFVSFTVSFELTVLLSRSILRPVEDLEAATERIRQGRFDEHVPVTTSDEFGELSSAFNQMVDGLAERERLREAFGTYLDEEVAQHLISEDFEPRRRGGRGLAGLLRRAGLHHRCGRVRRPPEVVARLNELFECIVPIVAATAATSTSSSATRCSPSSARPSASPSTPTARSSARWRSPGRSTAGARAASRSASG